LKGKSKEAFWKERCTTLSRTHSPERLKTQRFSIFLRDEYPESIDSISRDWESIWGEMNLGRAWANLDSSPVDRGVCLGDQARAFRLLLLFEQKSFWIDFRETGMPVQIPIDASNVMITKLKLLRDRENLIARKAAGTGKGKGKYTKEDKLD
jgi:hypothetical protein